MADPAPTTRNWGSLHDADWRSFSVVGEVWLAKQSLFPQLVELSPAGPFGIRILRLELRLTGSMDGSDEWNWKTARFDKLGNPPINPLIQYQRVEISWEGNVIQTIAVNPNPI
jgi:hypothetical protein